jgi:hypothetical protein
MIKPGQISQEISGTGFISYTSGVAAITDVGQNFMQLWQTRLRRLGSDRGADRD